jgi:hypothetical protein
VTVPVDPIAIALAVTRAHVLGIIHTIGGSIASSIAGEPQRARCSAGRVHEALSISGGDDLLTTDVLTPSSMNG